MNKETRKERKTTECLLFNQSNKLTVGVMTRRRNFLLSTEDSFFEIDFFLFIPNERIHPLLCWLLYHATSSPARPGYAWGGDTLLLVLVDAVVSLSSAGPVAIRIGLLNQSVAVAALVLLLLMRFYMPTIVPQLLLAGEWDTKRFPGTPV